MNTKYKPAEEWFRQADYDFKTAQAMFKAKRYLYTVFFCHLSIEKALKGIYAQRLKKDPPKVHNLNYFCDKLELELSLDFKMFINKLNDLSVPTRYPDEIESLVMQYDRSMTLKVLNKTKGILLWLKKV